MNTPATSYPSWFPMAIWLTILSPLIPGTIALIISIWKVCKQKDDAFKWFAASGLLLVIGLFFTLMMTRAI